MDNIVDVDYNITSDNKSYYDLEEVTKILRVEEHNIVYWCNKFNDILKIKSVGQHHIFDTYDIKNLKIIKEYNLVKGMSVREIKDQLNRTQEIILKTEIDTVEISMLNVFAKIMNMQNQKIDSLIETQNKLIEFNEKLLKTHVETKQTFENTLKEVSVDMIKQQEAINKLASEIQTANRNRKDEFTSLERSSKTRDAELIMMLKQSQEEQRRLFEEQNTLQQQPKQGFFSRIFNKR